MAANRPPVNPKKLRPYDQPRKDRRPLVPEAPDSAATGFVVAGTVWLAAALGIGALWGALRLVPDLVVVSLQIPLVVTEATLGVEVSALTAGHGFWNALLFGWLANALIGAALFGVPRVTGKPLLDESLAYVALFVWNIAAVAGLTALYIPALAAPGPLAELPLPVDGAMALAALMLVVVVLRPLLAAPRSVPYVGVAFSAAGLLFLLGAVGLGAATDAAAVFIDLDPTAQALLYGVYGRMLIGLGLGGLGLGALYCFVPRLAGRDLWSSGVGWLAWVLWLGLGSVALLGALEDRSVPFVLTQAGNAATIALLAPALLTAANLLLTMSGRWTLVLSPGGPAFAVVSIGFAAGVALMAAIGSLGSVHALVGGTAWESGVLLWATAGAGGFAALASADHAVPRLLHRDWRSGLLTSVALYATFAGIGWAGFSLITEGLAQGSLRLLGTPADEAAGHLVWYALSAAAGFGLAALGGLASLVDLFLQYTTARSAAYAMPTEAPTASEPAGAGAGAAQ